MVVCRGGPISGSYEWLEDPTWRVDIDGERRMMSDGGLFVGPAVWLPSPRARSPQAQIRFCV